MRRRLCHAVPRIRGPRLLAAPISESQHAMDPTELHRILEGVVATLTNVGLKVVGALILYLIGRWLITWVIGLVQRTLERQKVDPTLLRYLGTVIKVLANVALVIALLGYFGVETTS